MELNQCYQAAIQYPHQRLPQKLHQYYPEEVPVSLWDQYRGLQGALLYEVTLTEGGLDQTNNFTPAGRVGGLFSC